MARLKNDHEQTDKTDEAQTIARAANGDAQAFEAIMRRHNRLLFRTARSVLKNDADAEDAVQDAYVQAWRALKDYRHEAKLSTWLVRITINEALARLRKVRATLIPLEVAMMSSDAQTLTALTEKDSQNPERMAARAQMRKLMETNIDRLPKTFRTVFVLRALEELSVEDVARALDIPQATVRTRYHRAKSMLRVALEKESDIALGDAFSFDGARCDRIVAHVLAQNPV